LPGQIADEWAYLRSDCVLYAACAGMIHIDAQALREGEHLTLLARR